MTAPTAAANGSATVNGVDGRAAAAAVAAELAAQETAQNQAAVIKVLERISLAETVAEVARRALDTVRQEFGWAYGSYWRRNADGSALVFDTDSGTVNEAFMAVTAEASFARGVGLSGRTWRRKELVFVDDIGAVTDCVRAPVATEAGVRSGVCFPIVVDGEVVGTMDFFATETLVLSEDRMDTLRTVGELVSQAVARVAQTEAAAETAQNARAITAVLQRVGRARTRDEVASFALESVREAFGWAYGSYWTPQAGPDGREALTFQVDSGTVTQGFMDVTAEASFARGVGLSGRTWERMDLVFTDDLGQVTDCVRAPEATKAGVQSGVCIPIVVEGSLAGTMDFFALEALHLSEDRTDALRSVGTLVSEAMERVAR